MSRSEWRDIVDVNIMLAMDMIAIMMMWVVIVLLVIMMMVIK